MYSRDISRELSSSGNATISCSIKSKGTSKALIVALVLYDQPIDDTFPRKHTVYSMGVGCFSISIPTNDALSYYGLPIETLMDHANPSSNDTIRADSEIHGEWDPEVVRLVLKEAETV
ncbi:hypothetical protein ANO11243_064760 [Dothideomycetidae sp. 11243]|nr:hypothetical protein ANO11243_064760 [fungal sp. No.11243]